MPTKSVAIHTEEIKEKELNEFLALVKRYL